MIQQMLLCTYFILTTPNNMQPVKPPSQYEQAYDYDQQSYPDNFQNNYVEQKPRSMLSLEEQNDLLKRKNDIINAINIASERLPAHQAAGLVANLWQESKLDPNALQKGGSKGIGLAQYSSNSPRAKAYLNELNRQRIQGKDKFDFSVRYITNEALNQNPDTISNAWLGRKNQDLFINAKSPSEAAGHLSLKFLRPGGSDSIKTSKAYKRGEIADFIYNMYNSNSQ